MEGEGESESRVMTDMGEGEEDSGESAREGKEEGSKIREDGVARGEEGYGGVGVGDLGRGSRNRCTGRGRRMV